MSPVVYSPSPDAMRQIAQIARSVAAQMAGAASSGSGQVDCASFAIALRHMAEQQPGFGAVEVMLRQTAGSESRGLAPSGDLGNRGRVEELVLERLRQWFWENWEACVERSSDQQYRPAPAPARKLAGLSASAHIPAWQSGARNGWEAMVLLDIPNCYFPATPEECFAYPIGPPAKRSAAVWPMTDEPSPGNQAN